jgi:hypothetical protein
VLVLLTFSRYWFFLIAFSQCVDHVATEAADHHRVELLAIFFCLLFFGSSTISPLRQTDHQKSLATNIYPVWARSQHLDPILAATLLLLRRMWTSFRGLSNGHGTSFLIGLLCFVRALEDERLPPFVCF